MIPSQGKVSMTTSTAFKILKLKSNICFRSSFMFARDGSCLKMQLTLSHREQRFINLS